MKIRVCRNAYYPFYEGQSENYTGNSKVFPRCYTVSVGRYFPTFLKDRCVFMFTVKQSFFFGLLDPQREDTMILRNVGNSSSSHTV